MSRVSTTHRSRSVDAALRNRLARASARDPEFWSFRGNAAREHTHAFFQYPAMMVPQLVARLLLDVLRVEDSIDTVFDPFLGSGTVLTESMIQGLDFRGHDLNPLAILLCRLKAGPFFVSSIEERTEELMARVDNDCGQVIEAKFPNWQKWFRRDVAIRLSRIARAIREEYPLWSRRFYWVALAETVRLTSNSRTSTFKLHIRPAKQIEQLGDPIEVFEGVVTRNARQLAGIRRILKDAGLLSRGFYAGTVRTRMVDSSKERAEGSAELADVLITSPPYGDNVTTVPYGQHSYLPLQWIDLQDIEPGLNTDEVLASTHEIDSRCLGGSRKNALNSVKALSDKSHALRLALKRLSTEPRDRPLRVAAFYRDFDNSLDAILSHLRPNAYMIWIVGNRRVADRLVPLNSILKELLESRGAVFVTEVKRHIPSKRMAIRNDIACTMTDESILVLRRGDRR